MPKQVYKIDMFHGGLNTHSDKRDILDNELAAATDVAVNELGKVRNLGGNTEVWTQPDAGDGTIGLQPGYGLFQFSNDVDGADATGDLGLSPTNYLALADTREGTASVVDISAGGGTWSNGATAGTGVGFSDAVSAKADMYYVDGVLRVNDADFGTSSSPTWFGYVGDNGANVDMMENASTKVTLTQKFYDLPSKPEKPKSSTFAPDEANGIAAKTYTEANIGIVTQTEFAAGNGDETYTVTDNNIKANSGPTTINLVTVTIDVDSDSEGSSLRGTWDYDLIVRQNGGGNSITITGVTGNGATQNQHQFSYPSGVSVGTTDWEVRLEVDGMSQDIVGISASRVVFEEAAQAYTDHTAILSNAEHIFHVALDQPGSDVTGAFGWDEDWQVGMTLIYDGNQESLMSVLKNKSGGLESFSYTEGARPPAAAIFCQYSANWNKRITGAVVYMKRLLDKQWFPQYELDFVKGMGKATFSNVERPVTFTTLNSEAHYIFQFGYEDVLEPQFAITYESRTGISHEEESISSMWKSSCVANRRAYIGNLKVFNEDGTTEVHNDKMVRSLPNKFDIFPISESVDVTINDGESIVALVEFNDRILQFKERTLYVINASQDMEFLEDKLDYRGIAHRASVFKTEYGVVWVNKNGCFYYDGRKVNDLLQKDGRPLIKQSDWENFLGTYPLVGYSPKKKQIIVVDDISNNTNGAGSASDGSCFIYDMITTSWVKGHTGTFDATAKTNFIIDWNGDLLHASSDQTNDSVGAVELYKWDDAADTSTGYSLETKDLDFGAPSQKKSIKKVYLTYKGDGTSVTTQYRINGDKDTVAAFYRTQADGSTDNTNSDTTPLLNVGTDDWVCAELKPVAGSVTCNSFALTLGTGGTVAADFEINDISIVYRPKTIK
tara:strand:- start:641 stop:3322 length:2682 start_codon:yes stop_codon:yes gene_type:complete